MTIYELQCKHIDGDYWEPYESFGSKEAAEKSCQFKRSGETIYDWRVIVRSIRGIPSLEEYPEEELKAELERREAKESEPVSIALALSRRQWRAIVENSDDVVGSHWVDEILKKIGYLDE